jgi:hypothetical protein
LPECITHAHHAQNIADLKRVRTGLFVVWNTDVSSYVDARPHQQPL